MAGALGVRLMGPRTYGGELVHGAWMGKGRIASSADDIRTALKIYRAACGVQLGLLAVLFGLTCSLASASSRSQSTCVSMWSASRSSVASTSAS